MTPRPILALPSPAARHAARTVAAAMLALYLAYALELDNPASAAVTVAIVSHPVHGMVWSKGIYRAAGTVIGAVMAIVLASLFAQQPELFLLGFALWMGLCTALSTVLRNFRSYGAVLAGYTVGLIAFPNLPGAPDSLFMLVTARVSAVFLGLACSALVGSLTTSRSSARLLETQLRDVVGRLASYVQGALTPHALKGTEAQRFALRKDIMALDTLMEFAAAEGTEVAGRIEAERGTIATMLSCLTACAAVQEVVAVAQGRSDALSDMIGIAAAKVDSLAGALKDTDRVRLIASVNGLLGDLAGLDQRIEDGLSSRDFRALRAFDRIDTVLDELRISVQGFLGLLQGDRIERQPRGPKIRRPAFHMEWRWAAINGARAALTVWLAGALWVGTAWPSGAMMIGAVVPTVALLSLRDRPDIDALAFVKGIALAALAGFLCLEAILPSLSGFPLLALCLGAFLFWGALQSLNPARAFTGLGFLVFFLTLLAPANAMHYDVGAYVNNALAVLFGAVLTAIVHRVVLPVHPATHIRALLADIRADLAALATGGLTLDGLAWEWRMHDRLLRLGMRLRSAGTQDVSLLHGTHAVLRIGRDIIRLQALAETQPLARRTVRAALRALGEARSNPRHAVHFCRQAARRLMRIAAQTEAVPAVALGQAATSLVDIALVLGRHRRFFVPGSLTPC